MKKIKLNIDELKVDSFNTSIAKSNKGTLLGNALPISDHPDNCTYKECTGGTCPIETCEIACDTFPQDNTCANTCTQDNICTGGPICTDGSCGGPIISCEKICIP